MTRRLVQVVSLGALSFALPTLALAAPPTSEPSGEANVEAGDEGGGAGEGKVKDRGDQPWIKRWAPEKHLVELGIYGGVFVASERLALYDADSDLPERGHRAFDRPAADFGLRLGYFPIRHFGVEAEAGLIPLQTEAGSASGYTVRGHVVGQLGLWSVTPFVLLGAGALGVSSDRAVVGIEVDPALHFGGGVKFFLNRWVSLRLDLRDVVSNRHGDSESFGAHDFEALLGLSVTLVRKREERKPPPPADGDGDGFIDAKDACPKEAGTEADGCPIRDEDGDGLVDAEDACPKEAGTETDGCPIRDTDNDGIMDPDDQCKDEPETKNRVDDQDGCPDEIPEEVKKFSGTIDGIAFENGKDTIKPESEAALAAALEILQKYPDLRLKVTGHTDDKGKPEDNLDLSRRRADAVVRWFTDHGLAADRLEAEGHGAEKPIADNKTKAGRTKNRRIEFELLQ